MDPTPATTEPRPRRWQYSLRTLLTLALLCALGLGIPKLVYDRSVGPLKDSHAAIQVAAMIHAYLDANECAWPRSWEDLSDFYQLDGRPLGGNHCTFEELQDCWVIDFQADPVALAQADPVVEGPPFRALWQRHDRPLARPYWDPNYRVFWWLRDRAARQVSAMIIEYLSANQNAWPRSWSDLRPYHEPARDPRGRHYCSFEIAQGCMVVDFTADAARLTRTKPEPRKPPFRVVRPKHPYPHEGEVLESDSDPNQRIFEYLQSTLPEPQTPRAAARGLWIPTDH